MSYKDQALTGVFDYEDTLDPLAVSRHKKYDDDQEEIKKVEDEAIMWWALDEPAMTDKKLGAIEDGSSLWPMIEALEIYPFKNKQGEYFIFGGHYKLAADKPLAPETLEAPPDSPDPPSGAPPPPVAGDKVLDERVWLLMNFIAGFQIECVEMLVAIGQYSSLPDGSNVKVLAQEGGGRKVPPVPDQYFEWPDEEKVLVNRMYTRTKDLEELKMEVLMFARRSDALQKHWWLQLVLYENDDRKWPVPGEFIGLGVKLFPGLPWGEQESSPFIYSGHWVDSFYYTSGVIKEVLPPDDTYAYPRYKVDWQTLAGENAVTLAPTDFAEYKVGDRVTILKDVSRKMESGPKFQTSEDGDTEPDCDKEKWAVCPITFYDDMGQRR